MNIDSKCKYLFVDSEEIFKKSKVLIEEDVSYENEYASKIFNGDDIDRKYHKIIFKINPLFYSPEIEEYFTHIPFDYTGNTIFRRGDSRNIQARSVINRCNNYIEFMTPAIFHTYEDVLNFCRELKENNVEASYYNILIGFFNDVNVRSFYNERKLVRK